MAAAEETDGPRKRQRTIRADSDAVRSEPWHDDGNVILLSEESKQFRVHRGILTSNSHIFKDMFGLGQPLDTTIDGCPTVQLSDRERDLRHVLKALYDRSYFRPDHTGSGLTFEVASALARLGKKYEFKSLHRDAVDVLTASLPMTLASFDQLPSKSNSAAHSGPGILVDLASCHNLFGILQLSRELDMPFLRPAPHALLLCLFSMEEILAEHDRSWSNEFPRDLRDYLLSREKLLLWKWETWSWLTTTPCSSESCTLYRCNKYSFYKRHGLPSIAISTFPAGLVCVECNSRAQPMHNNSRQKVWQVLPAIFGLPDWTELETLKSNCIV